jgi:hypothetical protein
MSNYKKIANFEDGGTVSSRLFPHGPSKVTRRIKKYLNRRAKRLEEKEALRTDGAHT